MDDIHTYCAAPPQHPKADQWDGQAPPRSFQDGLNDFVNYLEEGAGEREIRIIASTRSEEEYWVKLDFKHHPVWKRFSTYELPPVSDDSLAKLLNEYAANFGLVVDDAFELVRNSDSMPQTIVGNVHRVTRPSSTGRRLSADNWHNTSDKTWKDIYSEIASCKDLEQAPLLYDAAYLLKECGLPLLVPLVIRTAAMLDQRRLFPRLRLGNHLRLVLNTLGEHYHYWIADGDQLTLRDGLLEGKTNHPSVSNFLDKIAKITVSVARTNPELIPELVTFATFALSEYRSPNVAIRVVKILEEQDDSLKCIGYMIAGDAHREMDQYNRAVKYYSQVLRLVPNDADAWNRRGLSLINMGKYSQAIEDCTQALKINPEYVRAYFNTGFAYLLSGKYSEAIENYSHAIELQLAASPVFTAQTYVERGEAYLEIRDYDKAISDFSQAFILDPACRDFYKRGIAYSEAGVYDKAIADLTQAISSDSPNERNYSARGRAYMMKREYGRAIEDYNVGISLNPRSSELWNQKGMAQRFSKRNTEAGESFRKALTLKPRNKLFTLNLTNLLRSEGRYKEALVWLSKLSKQDRSDPEVHIAFASVYWNLGKTDQFQEHLSYSRDLLKNPHPYTKTCIESVAGNIAGGLAALSEAISLSDVNSDWIQIDADLENIRQSPQFWRLVEYRVSE